MTFTIREAAPDEPLTTGLWRVTDERYHADPVIQPSLSSSIAKLLVETCPRKAWHAHPRLNPDYEAPEPSKAMDFGTACHQLLTGQGENIVEVPGFDNWQKKAAQEARDEIRAAGKAPMLTKELDKARAMEQSAREQLPLIADCQRAFKDGAGEVTMVWVDERNGVHYRAKADWIEPRRDDTGHLVVYDYKTTGTSAAPHMVARQIYNMDYHVQHAFYERGLEALAGDAAGLVVYRFVIQETEAPYLLTVVELDSAGITIGRKKVGAAASLWARCMETGNWPGYAREIVAATMPAWAENQWLEREMEDPIISKLDADPFQWASPWAPHVVQKLATPC